MRNGMQVIENNVGEGLFSNETKSPFGTMVDVQKSYSRLRIL